MNKILKIQEKILNLIYPQTCGICGKINENSLCKKCEIKLNKQAENRIIKEGTEIEDKYFNELMYIFRYEGQIRKLIIDYKFNDKAYLYKMFVNFLLKNKKIFENIKNYDTIIPVPISKKRKNERGYNQSLLISRNIAEKTNLELMNNCLIKTKNIIEQSKLNKEDRLQNIQGVYDLKNKKLLENRKILLIDDIYTTGSTANECSKTLRAANPDKVGILVLAKD
ncbi:MAG: ComF family protein [Clostridia bacterium]